MKIFIVFFLLVIDASSFDNLKAREESVFKIFEPGKKITLKKLKASGFLLDEGVDVTLLTKEINDSTRLEFMVSEKSNEAVFVY